MTAVVDVLPGGIVGGAEELRRRLAVGGRRRATSAADGRSVDTPQAHIAVRQARAEPQ